VERMSKRPATGSLPRLLRIPRMQLTVTVTVTVHALREASRSMRHQANWRANPRAGMDKMQKSMASYVKSLSKRAEGDDREKQLPQLDYRMFGIVQVYIVGR
jgi:hypothetical protein